MNFQSNDKLELASQLQSEEYLNRDVRNRFTELENELKSVKEKLHFKDEEMIRLTHENSQFDAQIQELSKKLDTNSNNNVTHVIELQKKLQNANKEIKLLRIKLREVSSGEGDGGKVPTNLDETETEETHEHTKLLQESNSHSHSHSHHHGHAHEHSHEHGHNYHHEHDHHLDDHDHCDHEHVEYATDQSVEALDNSDVVSVTSTINIATNEAMDKLQERFKRTMNEIADLTEEKHRLEHLVTQLQSETETIGEYIALYQTQRRQLKQRELEKDIQLNRIAADREFMREKLRQLNELVELLLMQKGFTNAKDIMAQLHTTNNNAENIPENIDCTPVNGTLDASTSGETNKTVTLTTVNNCEHNNHEHGHDHNPPPIDLHSHVNQTHLNANTRETATKIINLLTDIKDRNQRQDYATVPNVDHCACCSGKLEVV